MTKTNRTQLFVSILSGTLVSINTSIDIYRKLNVVDEVIISKDLTMLNKTSEAKKADFQATGLERFIVKNSSELEKFRRI